MKETERVLKQFLQQPDAAQECLSLEAEQRLSWERQLLLRLPQVFSLKQAQQQSDALQLQAYQKTRKLQGIDVTDSKTCSSSLATVSMSLQVLLSHYCKGIK